MQVNTPKIYTALLFIPVIGFFIPNERINEYAYFLVVLALIVVAYLCYLFNFQSNVLNLIRKYLACLCTAALVLILSAQLSDILINVYNTDYGEEISFAVKMILMLSNMEGNLELCTQKRGNHKAGSSEVEQVSHGI